MNKKRTCVAKMRIDKTDINIMCCESTMYIMKNCGNFGHIYSFVGSENEFV